MFRQGFTYILLFGIISGAVLFAYTLVFYQNVDRTITTTTTLDGKKQNISHSTISLHNDSDHQSLLSSKSHEQAIITSAVMGFNNQSLSSSVFNTSMHKSVITITANSIPTQVSQRLSSSIFNSSLGIFVMTTTPSTYRSRSIAPGTLYSTLFPHLTVAKSTTPANTILSNFSSTSTLSPTTASALKDNDTRLICHTFNGRLGNILFQYASVLGLSYSLNRTAIFRNSQYIDQVLKNSTNHPTRHQELNARCDGAPGIGESSCCKFDPRLYDLNPLQDYWVRGYLQSYKYFEQYQDRIRAAITFNDTITKGASSFVSKLRQLYRDFKLIGVHARMGDFLSERNKKLGYPVATPDYYNRSFTYFTNKFPNCVFVVSSENIDWCKANMPGGFNVTYLDKNPAALDMAILSSLDHMVTTFGTFSWWSGYLNSGITVYMRDFIKPNTHIGKQFLSNGTGYILPGWVPI